MAGMSHGLHQGAVIGKQQQSLTVPIQPPHREYAYTTVLHQLCRSSAPQLIAQRCHIAARFIQHQIYGLFRKCNFLSVNRNHICLRICFVAQCGHSAIACHTSLCQQHFRRAPGADARLGNQFLHSLRHDASSICFPAPEKPNSYRDL